MAKKIKAKKEDKKTSEIDEAICGSRTLRFESIKGFAQRRPTEKKEAKPNASDDNTGCAEATDGDEPCADSSGHCVSCRAK